jgi:signal transduction histidine kinase
MRLTLRHRIFLTLAPLLAILALLGGGGFVLLSQLGGRIDVILRENYDSVIYMERLHEALERIDSSFQFALAGREKEAREQYAEYWNMFRAYLEKEQNNITLPGEQELVDRLTALSAAYRLEGDAFFALPATPDRHRAYFGEQGRSGLLDTFKGIKAVSGQILRMNQDHMQQASRDARETAASSLVWFGLGLAVAAVLAVYLALHTGRTLLQPIQAVTESALAIGAGNLDQVVPVLSNDELGQLAGAFNTMARQLRDYRQSQQARMLRLQQTSQATINAFPHPVLVVDNQGRVEMANPAARRILGVMPDSGEDKAPITWQPPPALRLPLAEALGSQRDYLPEGFEQTILLRAGIQDLVFLPRVLAIRDPYGATLGAAVLLEDVTRFRLLDQVKSDLVATVSHELKTPLTSIRLAVHVLLEETLGPLTPKQLELLLDARDNTGRLLAMINNLLDLARLERGGERLSVQPEQPLTLLQEAANAIRPRAEDKGIAVVVDAPVDLPPVAVDVEQLGHALHNLLDNALRHTHRGGRITLAAHAMNGAVVLSVADTGVGIPPEHLPHVFDRFFRVPGQDQEGGTGLGLAIVREIVTAHSGTVTCESRPGVGTTFTLTLPAWTSDGRVVTSTLLTS